MARIPRALIAGLLLLPAPVRWPPSLLARNAAEPSAPSPPPAARPGNPAEKEDRFAADGKMRGVCFVAGGRIDSAVFQPLVRNHTEWISQTPFGWMRAADDPAITLATSGHVYWGETDEGLLATGRMAREAGLRTLLKPHLWVGGHDTVWTGDIKMKTDADWRTWFEAYRKFILHYARLAEEGKFEALAVGTELPGATLGHEKEWRDLIRRVREGYRGRLTYAANWDREFEAIAFWDALDFAGVQAYFPLSAKPEATVEELAEGWAAPRAMLERVARRTGRPVVLTEVGYKSADRAAEQPWLWRSEEPVDLEEQSRCYEAMFRALWDRSWFKGVFIWKWFPGYDTARSASDRGFTPQGKPAERVLRQWYGLDPSPPRPAAGTRP